jgi:phage shock protein A
MAIIARIVKIFKADIHGVMDQFENKGLLLKQYLREMEEALHFKEAKLQKMTTSRHHRLQDLDRYKQQRETLEHDLTMAVRKNKDDIARMLIKRMKPLENLDEELSRHVKELDEEIDQFEKHLQQQRLKYEKLKNRSTEFLHKTQLQKWQKEAAGPFSYDSSGELSEQQIELELLKRKEKLGSNVS